MAKINIENTPKKTNPFIGILLLFISIILFSLTIPIGLIYGFLFKLFTKSIKGIGDFSLKIAIALDQLGNVLMQHLLNEVMILKGGYKFGNRDETISSVLGKNIEMNTLSTLGKGLNSILDVIELGHSLNSIDYYIEPLEDTIKR